MTAICYSQLRRDIKGEGWVVKFVNFFYNYLKNSSVFCFKEPEIT